MIFALIIIIVLLVIFISKVNTLSNRLADLEREIAGLGSGTGVKKPGQAKPSEPVSAAPLPPAVASAGVAQPVDAQRHLPPSKEKPSRSREEWEALIGGKILNRIGALALIIATAFFLKLAFDRDLIGETGRVLIGGVAGVLSLLAAYRARSRGFDIFAQGLVGAGIAILYLSVYASFNYYQLVPQWVAFLLMSVVTIVTLAQGVYYNSLAVAILGWAGGFLTPFLLSTGQSNEIGLFTYIALLDIGLLAVYIYRGTWKVLEPLILGGTWITYVAWYDQFYTAYDLGTTVFFALVFWGLFFGIDIIRFVKKIPVSMLSRIGSAANAMIVFLALYAIVDPSYHEWMGGLTLLLGLLYLGVGILPEHLAAIPPAMRKQNVILSILFLVIATEIQFTGLSSVFFWSLEGGLLLWIGSRLRDREIVVAATILLGCTILRWMSVDGAVVYRAAERFVPVLNTRFGTTAMMVAAFGVGSWSTRQFTDLKPNWIRSLFDSLLAGGVFVLLTIEVNDLFRSYGLGVTGEDRAFLYFAQVFSFALLWSGVALAFVWTGFRISSNGLVVWGVGTMLLAMIVTMFRGLFYAPIERFIPILNLRFGSMFVLIGLVAIHARWFRLASDARRWYPIISSVMRYGILALLFILLSGETRDIFQRQIVQSFGDREMIGELRDMQQLSLSGVWILYSAALMTLGIWRSMRGIRIAAFGLFGFTILKIFLYDLSFLDTIYRILSFLVLGIVLLGVSFAYQRFRDTIFGTTPDLSGHAMDDHSPTRL